jgi:RNA recognition motif-containing protein
MDRNVNSDHLEEIFSKFGRVVDVDLQTDKATKISKVNV